MSLACAELLERHREAWTDATQHAFLRGCRDGSIAPQQFNTWLTQDYLFVCEFTRLVGRTLAAAPVSHFDVLLAGLGALKEELQWFRVKAAERQLTLATPRQTACETYCRLMARLADAPYAVQATALWAIEAVYNEAWRRAAPMVEPYDEFAQRWGNPAFTTCVAALARQADEALASASAAEQERAQSAFIDVVRLEKDFWQMAFEAQEHR